MTPLALDLHKAPPRTLTRILQAWQRGEPGSEDALFRLVHSELNRMARGYSSSRRDQTLEPAALLNEVYIRLVSQTLPDLQSRRHFFAIASRLMRQVLVDYSRTRKATKRGGQLARVTLSEAMGRAGRWTPDMLDLSKALDNLERLDPRKARTIEMRHFGGMTVEEICEVESISEATVRRDIRFAEAWLLRALGAKA